MKELKVVNKRNSMFIGNVRIANKFTTRLKGLLGSSPLSSFQGLLIKPCKQVHTIGMRYSISIWYVDQKLRIVRIIDDLEPFKISPYVGDSHLIIEFPSKWAEITGSQEGDLLDVYI
ncbi:MAG: hypothetical protein APF84_17235 [Gracilibacter sp. BRH_c7a]|nr:MAG: hypothetical protein APF84_17235 [Gracilibacter sp. BRH_c7a]